MVAYQFFKDVLSASCCSMMVCSSITYSSRADTVLPYRGGIPLSCRNTSGGLATTGCGTTFVVEQDENIIRHNNGTKIRIFGIGGKDLIQVFSGLRITLDDLPISLFPGFEFLVGRFLDQSVLFNGALERDILLMERIDIFLQAHVKPYKDDQYHQRSVRQQSGEHATGRWMQRIRCSA